MVSHKPGKLTKERTQWSPEGKTNACVFSSVPTAPCVTPSHAAAAASSPLRKAGISLPLLSLHQLPSCSEHPEITSSMQTVFLISKKLFTVSEPIRLPITTSEDWVGRCHKPVIPQHFSCWQDQQLKASLGFTAISCQRPAWATRELLSEGERECVCVREILFVIFI